MYKYTETREYPAHDLLIECTLAQGLSGQRRMEMEPVSRHLATYMVSENMNSYCTFVSNELHPSVISDFRGRKYTSFYVDEQRHVDSMKILMLDTDDLRNIILNGLLYSDVYEILDRAFSDVSVCAPPEWYKIFIKQEIANFSQPEMVCEDYDMAAEPQGGM